MDEPCFVSDIYLPKMLYAHTIRSPVAKGRLQSIECGKLPSGYTLIQAKDIPGKNLLDNSSMPLLAADELSYIGEPVALLLGPDKNILEDCINKCTVIAAEEEPVFSYNHSNTGMIAAERDMLFGNTETAFTGAAHVVQNEYNTGIQEHWYAEPSGAVTWFEQRDDENRQDRNTKKKNEFLIVRTATQWPYHVRRSVAQALGLPASAVLVKPTITGPHMDGKLWYTSLISCHAALGAWVTQRPVRLLLTRKEDFFYSPKRCGATIKIASAHNEKGDIMGIDINVGVNTGAFGINKEEILDSVNLGCLGVYRTKNIHFHGFLYKTNIPPQGPFAGFGIGQGLFASERHVSSTAEQLKSDPVQWRKDNILNTGLLPLGLHLKETGSFELLIDAVVKMSDYNRKYASYELMRHNTKEKSEYLRGIGIALGYQGNSILHPESDRGNFGIEITLEKDGSLEIKTSMTSSGTNYAFIWGRIANEILGVDPEIVRINNCTEYAPDSGPSVVSRNITVLTKLVEQACHAIRKLRFRDPLPLTVRKTARAIVNPKWDECFPHPKSLVLDSGGFIRPGLAAAVVETEIDQIESIPCIRGVWLCVDGGRIINEDNARASLKASVVQALGWAYREQISYVDGSIPAEQYDNFDIPGLSDIPPVFVEFVSYNQDEQKGIGDLPFNCVPAAYLQAVSQAINRQLNSIPLKPGRII